MNIDLRIIFLILVIIIILGYYFLSILRKKKENLEHLEYFAGAVGDTADAGDMPDINSIDPSIKKQLLQIQSDVEKITGVEVPPIYQQAFEQSNISEMIRFNLTIDPKRRDPSEGTTNSFRRLLVPIHMIKLLNGKYLAVFNDGRLYSKTNLYDDKLWVGPLDNSLVGSPEDGLGMRMVMLFPLNKNGGRYIKLIGVGQDNCLYYKETEEINSRWIKADTNGTNNDKLVYLFCDYQQTGDNYYPILYGITTEGDFVSKLIGGNTPDESIEEDKFMKLPFNNPSPAIINNIKVLKVFWDKNGFMIGIGTDFRVYQKKGVDWKIRPWEVDEGLRGTNDGAATQVIDLLMESDGRMVGLVLDSESNPSTIKIQKQNQSYYLADFDILETVGNGKEMYNEYELYKFKTGLDINTYLSFLDADETLYRTNNLQALYQRSLMEDKYRLRKLCKNRSPNGEARNFDLEEKLIEKNNLINSLNNELEWLLKSTIPTMPPPKIPSLTPTPTP